ncbi:MAG: hypothetical protein WCA24_14065, partial [Thiomonas sp.]
MMDMRVAGQVREAAEAVGNGSADWTALLRAWRDIAGADTTTFFAWDKTSGALWGRAAVDLSIPAGLGAYVEHYQAFDPMVPIGLAKPAGTWIDSAADLSPATWRSGPYYADLLRPLRIEQTVALTLCNDAAHLSSISLHFNAQQNRSRKSNSVRPLIPALLEAFRMRLRFRDTEWLKMDAFVSNDSEGWLLIDTGMRVRHACPATAQLLSGDAALQVQDRQLHPRHAALASRLAIAVARVRADGLPQAVHCAAGWGRVLRLRLTRPPRHLLAFGEPLLVLRVQLLNAARLPDIDALRTVYSLSAAEARLVRELVAGHSLDDCAFLFAVSRNT